MHEIMLAFDFYIPQCYRGKNVNLFLTSKITDNQIILKIPADASYFDVNSLEDEESLGCQDLSGRQEIVYFNSDKKLIDIQNLDGKLITFKLMNKLEEIFAKQY